MLSLTDPTEIAMPRRIRAALLVTLALGAPAVAQTPAPPPTQDPALTVLFDCHFGYARQHFRSTASATEIATAAASYCEPALQAAGLGTYLRALDAGLPADSAEASRISMLDELRAMLPGFTIDKVLQFRAASDAP